MSVLTRVWVCECRHEWHCTAEDHRLGRRG